MEDKNLQVENGNFTRIINPVIEELIKIPFKGCEIQVALFIIRKTWGYGKTEDEISLTQIEKAIFRSRPTIVKALKNLQLVNIAKLVKRGDSEKCSNLYKINKYIDTWQLVKLPQLVKCKRSTSKGGLTPTSKGGLTPTSKGGLTHKRKIKENTKEILSAIADCPSLNNPKVNRGIEIGLNNAKQSIIDRLSIDYDRLSQMDEKVRKLEQYSNIKVNGKPVVNQRLPQYSIGKDSIGKNILSANADDRQQNNTSVKKRSEAQQVIDYWIEKYTNTFGDSPVVSWGKVIKLANPKVNQLGLDRMKLIVDRYFVCDDEIVKRNKWDVGTMLSDFMINKLK